MQVCLSILLYLITHLKKHIFLLILLLAVIPFWSSVILKLNFLNVKSSVNWLLTCLVSFLCQIRRTQLSYRENMWHVSWIYKFDVILLQYLKLNKIFSLTWCNKRTSKLPNDSDFETVNGRIKKMKHEACQDAHVSFFRFIH